MLAALAFMLSSEIRGSCFGDHRHLDPPVTRPFSLMIRPIDVSSKPFKHCMLLGRRARRGEQPFENRRQHLRFLEFFLYKRFRKPGNSEWRRTLTHLGGEIVILQVDPGFAAVC